MGVLTISYSETHDLAGQLGTRSQGNVGAPNLTCLSTALGHSCTMHVSQAAAVTFPPT